MTFWQYVEEVPDAEPDVVRRCEMTARLHAALRGYDGTDLGFWTPFNAYIPEGLAMLGERPDLLGSTDHERAQREWGLLSPLLASRAAVEDAFPGVEVQTIHGDAPFHNMISTADGDRWSDFELVTQGPAESDLTMAGSDGIAAYNEAAARLGLRLLDERLLRVTEAAGMLGVVACLAMAPELPLLVDGVKTVLDRWRDGPSIADVLPGTRGGRR
ncbi:MAG: hypothetical protein ABWY45_09365 [Mycobacterium sp.]